MTAEHDERWHGDLLALDPSIRSPGVALFRHGILVAADRVKIPGSIHKLPIGTRCERVAREVADWWRQECDDTPYVIRTVIFEWPQIYRFTKSSGDPNDLVPLGAVGIAFQMLVSAANLTRNARPPELLTPQPAEWTGQLPKSKTGDPWLSPRGARIKGKLQPGELSKVPAQHDAIDALGLGLWALGRFSATRVFSGAV